MHTARRTGASVADRRQNDVVSVRDLVDQLGRRVFREAFLAVVVDRREAELLVQPRRSPAQQLVAVPLGIIENRSEEHTSELQSLMRISYAVFCLKKKKIQ